MPPVGPGVSISRREVLMEEVRKPSEAAESRLKTAARSRPECEKGEIVRKL